MGKCESPEAGEDVTALGLSQRSASAGPERADSAFGGSGSGDDKVLVSKRGELEEVDKSAFGILVANDVEQLK